MRVVSLAAGAGGMICGSCLRDNRLVATLREMGRDVVLLPLYTPIRTDEADASLHEVRFGGINVYLEQKGISRLPGWLTQIFDAPALLRHAMKFSSSVRAESLGALTVSILAGPQGAQRSEIPKLLETLRAIEPDVINLPNLMLIGIAEQLKAALGVPIICTLSGEDIFLDQLREPQRGQAFDLIRHHARHVAGFIAVTNYFADHAARHFELPRERIHVVPMGIRVEDFSARDSAPARLFTVGYLARICPEKGLANLVDAMIRLHAIGKPIRVLAAGYLAKPDRAYFRKIMKSVEIAGLAKSFTYLGEVTRSQKVELLQSIHAFSVPTEYAEAKGLYILEALASGVPVVQPQHGSFPELVDATGGGLLYDPAGARALAESIGRLIDDEALRRQLGRAGREAVTRDFTDTKMAEKTWAVYESLSRI